ncbi:MAG: hypothetical protein ACTSYH_03595 [Candidatus Heimdallarchaeaceae archaeon]
MFNWLKRKKSKPTISQKTKRKSPFDEMKPGQSLSVQLKPGQDLKTLRSSLLASAKKQIPEGGFITRVKLRNDKPIIVIIKRMK